MSLDEKSNILRIEGLTRKFGGLTAVKDVSFEAVEGGILGIIGPNGAGKSTLFNLIAGVDTPTSGRILLRGVDIAGKSSHVVVTHGLAKTFQLAAPMVGMTVREVLTLAAFSKRARAQVREIGMVAYLQAVAEDLGIVEHLDANTETLNVGTLRLVDIGRMMATAADVLLLDEPFSSLSNEEIARVDNVIRSLSARGMTVVMVEHKLPALMRLVDKIVVMNFGEKIAYGTPEEVVEDENVIKAYLGTKAVRMFDGSS